MPRKRKIYLRVNYSAPNGMSKAEIKGHMLDSIRNGTYDIGKHDITAQIKWRNDNSDWKADEWKNALDESATSSNGFDKAVIGWLRRWKTR